MASERPESIRRRIPSGRASLGAEVEAADLGGRKFRHEPSRPFDRRQPASFEDAEVERFPERKPVEIHLGVGRMPRGLFQQEVRGNSLWWNPGERRGRPVLPVGARRPADKAREGGIPGVFRPKRNDERREATRFSRDGSPAEPPPGELGRLGFTTGC